MIFRKVAFLFILIFLNDESFAQKTITLQSLYWLRYYNQLSINKNLTWHNEFEDRRFFANNVQHHFIIHSRVHNKILPNLDIAAGLCYSLQSPQIPNSITTIVVPEIRPEQEINLTNAFGKRFILQHRLRLDERFIQKNNGAELLNGHDFNLRFRYRLQASYKLSNADAKQNTTLKMANELMVNAGKNIVYNQFDQNRISLGLEQGLNKNISVELGYIHWYQQRAAGNQFFSRNILRFTIYHKLTL